MESYPDKIFCIPITFNNKINLNIYKHNEQSETKVRPPYKRNYGR